ncbi:hypothetical protein BCR34DRAFT_196602 [Clohesyomyces aquaticus]|uniref:Secreted protein n=1 Tax=Clohesyomyces aquaticus TaxID=1231657 RepID=A0A1Y1ZXM5_9PLEO|nr:hypothetical protein BCR34DRAFT_196602 [Clohesyomyces aquaticus]
MCRPGRSGCCVLLFSTPAQAIQAPAMKPVKPAVGLLLERLRAGCGAPATVFPPPPLPHSTSKTWGKLARGTGLESSRISPKRPPLSRLDLARPNTHSSSDDQMPCPLRVATERTPESRPIENIRKSLRKPCSHETKIQWQPRVLQQFSYTNTRCGYTCRLPECH